jgi:NADH:ubiquinone oxidoreductase subunit F (NADH-binding)
VWVTIVHRVLSPQPVSDLADYIEHHRGGLGLERAREMAPDDVIAEVLASGLRGRGGAGFPTGTKWRTVRDYRSDELAATVVVNAAEGEPGTFKDRTILLNNPFAVLEGALIAAHAVGANEVLVGTKAEFTDVVRRIRGAIAEVTAAGWIGDLRVEIVEGPDEYLYGEETALLEVADGRLPFPRVNPPYRRGYTEVVATDADVESESGSAAPVEMAGPTGATVAPPALVNNVETLANVPKIVDRGADWFRTEGTPKSPGTVVVTITGASKRAGIGEMMLGAPLSDAIAEIGGGVAEGGRIKAVLSGVSNRVLPGDRLDVAMTHDDLAAVGSGLGSAGFILIDEDTSMVAVAAGVARFLAVESCGQCARCKEDGLALADALERLRDGVSEPDDLATVNDRLTTINQGARCNLAAQQQAVVGSIMELFAGEFERRAGENGTAVDPFPVAELDSLDDDVAHIAERQAIKQPDWSYDAVGSSQWPADRFADHRALMGRAHQRLK